MHQKKVDYTNTFCHLMNLEIKDKESFKDYDFQNWKKRWQERLKANNNRPEKYLKLMRSATPLVIPRNHIVENVLKKANQGNFEPINNFLKILSNPYTDQKHITEYQIPSQSDENYQTFCGT